MKGRDNAKIIAKYEKNGDEYNIPSIFNAGETKEVSFEIDNFSLVYYTANDLWESETGKFSVFIGGDSDVKDNKSFDLIN